MRQLQLRLWLWWRADDAVRWLLSPWLWYGRWESERVTDWYLATVAANCYFWEETLRARLDGFDLFAGQAQP